MKQQIREIVISGSPLCVYLQTHYLFTVDGLSVYLPPRLFRVAAILAMRRLKGNGWVKGDELYPGGLAGKYLIHSKMAISYRIKQSMIRGDHSHRYLSGWKLRECEERKGYPSEYRLLADPDRTNIRIGPDIGACGIEEVIREAAAFAMYSTRPIHRMAGKE